jgi:hypothetical protein
MIRPLLLAALLCGGATVHARTPQPGEKRTGTIEVSVTYSGEGGWQRGAESGKHQLSRRLTYRAPLVGYHGPASGWKEIDSKLPPAIEGPIPEQKMTAGDIEDLSSAVEAAEARCGDDEACLIAALRGTAQALQASGKIEVPKTMPRGNMPDFTRFVTFGVDCPAATATYSVADQHQDVTIEASEGASGLNRRAYTVAGTRTARGESMAHCRASAVLDTRTNKLSLFVPIDAQIDAVASDSARDRRRIDFTGTGGVAAMQARLADRLRWLEVPASKTTSGRRVLENINEASGDATPIRATVEWKVSVD